MPKPHRLKNFGEVIADERYCSECNYDLRGLRMGGRCPECGEPIDFGSNLGQQIRLRDHFTALLFVDCLVFFAFGVVGIMLPMGLLGARFLPNLTPAQALTQNLLLSIMWLLGVVMLRRAHQCSAPRGRGLFADWAPLIRQSAVISQGLLPALAIVLYSIGITGSPALAWLAGLVFLGVAAGWVPVALLLSDYADHFGDSHLAGRFRSIAWLLGVFGVGSLLVIALGWTNTGFATIIRAFGWLVIVVWAFAFLAMCASTLQVANSVRWAYVHAKAARARDDRMRAKAKQDAASGPLPPPPQELASDPAMLANLEAQPPNPEVFHEPQIATGDRVIAKSADSPYGLEGDA